MFQTAVSASAPCGWSRVCSCASLLLHLPCDDEFKAVRARSTIQSPVDLLGVNAWHATELAGRGVAHTHWEGANYHGGPASRPDAARNPSGAESQHEGKRLFSPASEVVVVVVVGTILTRQIVLEPLLKACPVLVRRAAAAARHPVMPHCSDATTRGFCHWPIRTFRPCSFARPWRGVRRALIFASTVPAMSLLFTSATCAQAHACTPTNCHLPRARVQRLSHVSVSTPTRSKRGCSVSASALDRLGLPARSSQNTCVCTCQLAWQSVQTSAHGA